ncbi:kynureninase [Nocardioides sp. CN2-186]|uniref:kynureninase n=1 Tax=Nocardioides tweenelious TaxID=3156607 RepID=UPI0032B320D7
MIGHAGTPVTRADCLAWDREDELAAYRERFVLPEGVIYLDGNSLGALPVQTAPSVESVIRREWGQGLVRSWNDAGWFAKPEVLGDLVAPLIGAGPGEVVIGESTSVSLFQMLTAAVRMRPGRRVVVAEERSFPTDLYLLASVQEIAGGLERRLLGPDSTLDDVLDDDVAVVLLSHVDYRTGTMHDLETVTRRIHDAGALVVWDLCHSAGAVPIDLTGAEVDFAVGCSYKYLNGGPGAPSFIYVAARHHEAAAPPLTGWHGHVDPFSFTPGYEPAPGISRFRIGTPPMISLAALESTLLMWQEIDLDQVRAKSLALTDLFIDLVETRLGAWVSEVVVPRDHAARGSQVSVRVDNGYAVMQALIDRGVIGDFRAPDLMRFGFAPLYLSATDVWDAVAVLAEILETNAWQAPQYAVRQSVT